MNPNDVFWVARYFHQKSAPIIAEAQKHRPTLHIQIDLDFGGLEGVTRRENWAGISYYTHEEDPSGLRSSQTRIRTKEDADNAIKRLSSDLDHLLYGLRKAAA